MVCGRKSTWPLIWWKNSAELRKESGVQEGRISPNRMEKIVNTPYLMKQAKINTLRAKIANNDQERLTITAGLPASNRHLVMASHMAGEEHARMASDKNTYAKLRAVERSVLKDQVRAQEASEASMFEAHQTIGNTKAKVQGIEGGVIAQIAASRITSPTPLAMARPPLPAPGAKVSEAPFRAEPLKRSRGPGAVAEDN